MAARRVGEVAVAACGAAGVQGGGLGLACKLPLPCQASWLEIPVSSVCWLLKCQLRRLLLYILLTMPRDETKLYLKNSKKSVQSAFILCI